MSESEKTTLLDIYRLPWKPFYLSLRSRWPLPNWRLRWNYPFQRWNKVWSNWTARCRQAVYVSSDTAGMCN